MKSKSISKYKQEGRVTMLGEPGVKEMLQEMMHEDHRRSMSEFLNLLVINEYARRHAEPKPELPNL